MSETYDNFIKVSEQKAFDKRHRQTINFNIGQYDKAVIRGKQQYQNIDLARKRAAHIKHKVLHNLDIYLSDFEANFVNNGGQVIYAEDKDEAVTEILKILKKHDARHVVKSKSMTTEELELNHHLEKNKIESLETDLGEYIVQIAGEKPYHIVTPAMHKSKEDIAELFNQKFDLPIESTPQEITAYVRKKLREKFIHADVGITGANFVIADIGGIAVSENESNALLSMSFPKVHIAIAGIEKLIPSIKDLQTFWPLLSTFGTGQNVTVYNSIITGPRKEGETDGPMDMYVVIIDNGRSRLLARSQQRRALSCIRCGACLNGCPIYKNIGGHTYATTYSGPIGSVITPFLCGIEEYKHLSYASSLCGKCSEVCPVYIPLHKLLLYNRRDFVREKKVTPMERLIMTGFKLFLIKRKRMDFFNSTLKNYGIQMFFKSQWGNRRELPVFQKKSFNKIMRERMIK